MVEVPARRAAGRTGCSRSSTSSRSAPTTSRQYTMAADRMATDLAHLTDAWQPAVLQLIAITAEAGQQAGKPVGVCGEAAADPLLACVLVGMGITSLSMASAAVARSAPGWPVPPWTPARPRPRPRWPRPTRWPPGPPYARCSGPETVRSGRAVGSCPLHPALQRPCVRDLRRRVDHRASWSEREAAATWQRPVTCVSGPPCPVSAVRPVELSRRGTPRPRPSGGPACDARAHGRRRSAVAVPCRAPGACCRAARWCARSIAFAAVAGIRVPVASAAVVRSTPLFVCRRTEEARPAGWPTLPRRPDRAMRRPRTPLHVLRDELARCRRPPAVFGLARRPGRAASSGRRSS